MKHWSQIVFFPRKDQEVEALVEGTFNGKKLVLTQVADMNGNELALTPNERQNAWECLYDSLFNFTGADGKNT